MNSPEMTKLYDNQELEDFLTAHGLTATPLPTDDFQVVLPDGRTLRGWKDFPAKAGEWFVSVR